MARIREFGARGRAVPEVRAATSVRRVGVKRSCAAFGLPRAAGGCEGAECSTTARGGRRVLCWSRPAILGGIAARGTRTNADIWPFDQHATRTRSVVSHGRPNESHAELRRAFTCVGRSGATVAAPRRRRAAREHVGRRAAGHTRGCRRRLGRRAGDQPVGSSSMELGRGLLLCVAARVRN